MPPDCTRFRTGSLFSTPGVLREIPAPEILQALSRHIAGDWGDVCDEDKTANDASLRDGSRLLSAYTATNQTKFWIITEADRSSTTVLLPEEY